MELVTRNYQQLGVIKDVGKYVDECDLCQRMKNKTEAPVEKFMRNEIPEKLWMYLIVDFITKLPLVVGKNVILVVYNQLFKMVHFVITTKETLVEGLAQLFRDNVQKLHKLPESIISDRELQIVVELIKKLNGILGIETRLWMAFHSQTDRQTE